MVHPIVQFVKVSYIKNIRDINVRSDENLTENLAEIFGREEDTTDWQPQL